MQSIAEKETYHLPTEHLQVFNVIKNTSNKYITKTKILNQLGYEYNSSNERWLRRVINSLVYDYGYPIGCSYKPSERGYYIITTEQEKQQAMRSIKKLADGSMKRYEALKRIKSVKGIKMKTESYFKEYNQFVIDQQKAIQELEQERNALESKIKIDKSTYKQLIMDGQDDKADNLYQATDADEKKLKALNKRLETKKSVSKEVKYQKTIELLKHQSELSSLYESEKQSALGKLKKVVDAYNEIIDEIEDINDRYEDEHQQYASIYSQEQLYDDKEAREALNGYFRENIFTSYINGNDLPYEHNNKLFLKR